MSEFDPREPDFDVVHRVAPGLYTCATRFLFMGQHPIHNRSVIVHVPDQGALAIINPAEPIPGMIEGIRRLEAELGATVRYLISPGDWHYLFMGAHLAAFPSAHAYVPPGRIPSKTPDFPYTLIDVEAEEPFPQLGPRVRTHVCRGLLAIDDPSAQLPRHELVFFFPEARAITSGDVFYYNGVDTLSPVQQAIGQRARVVDFHHYKARMIRDRAAFQRSLEHILTWDFDRYISIHGVPGNMLERGAHADLERVLAWVQSDAR